MQSKLLTSEQLAEILNVAPSTIKSWSKNGRIPTVWLSRTVRRFELSAVMDALQAKAAKAGLSA